MKTFTDDEIQKIRSDSAERFDGRILRVDLSYPDCDATIVVAPYDRASFATHWDARSRDVGTSQTGALLTRLLWPGFVEVEALRKEWPVLAEDVADQLLAEAGWRLTSPVVERLDASRPPPGLSGAEARDLIAKTAGKLWSVSTSDTGLSCVMKSPLADTWLAARTLHGDARAKAKGVIAATENYTLDAVIWSRVPLTGGKGLLDLAPAVYWDLRSAYQTLGGDGAAVSRKSL